MLSIQRVPHKATSVHRLVVLGHWFLALTTFFGGAYLALYGANLPFTASSQKVDSFVGPGFVLFAIGLYLAIQGCQEGPVAKHQRVLLAAVGILGILMVITSFRGH